MFGKVDTSVALNAVTGKIPKVDIKNEDDRRLKEQTDNFESIMLKTLLETSLKSENALFPKAVGHDIYQSMYKENLSNQLSGGFGYSELLFNYLKEQKDLVTLD